MKTISLKYVLTVGIVSIIAFSCVPQRKFDEVKEKKERCEEERNKLRNDNESLTTATNEQIAELERLKKEINALVSDTTIKGNSYRTLTVQYDKISELYKQLLDNEERLRMGADAETQRAMALLQETRLQLQKKEDDLRALEARLNEERGNLEAMKIRLDMQEKELEEKY